MKKRIYIAYTGGTIGMIKAQDCYVPAPGYLEAQMEQMPELISDTMPDYVVHEYDPLLDSANMTPGDWHKIARDIFDHYERFDGFVVLHGTDTMAYTASALPFILSELNKPVILTGSQIPLCEVRNDARENLITAMLIAANYPIPEVCLYFNAKLLRGCRSVKVDAEGFDAFASPNYPPLGVVGTDIDIRWDMIHHPPKGPEVNLDLSEIREQQVATLRLYPGLPSQVVRNVLRPPLKGLVLEAYGVGNGPNRDVQFIDALNEATGRGVVIIDCSQCLKGMVDLNDYATGVALADAGVISGFDLTTEAALTKMIYLFSQDISIDDVKRVMQTNLAGELTPPTVAG